jgi:CPA2 family monovalent cation:H+ antiporter-2
MGDSATLLLTVFGAALLASGLATYIGFSGAVAAFLVGLILTGDVAIVARVRLAPLRDLFAAIFFVFFGLQTNPADIPPVLFPALLLALLGAATKWFTAWWAMRGLGDSKETMSVAAILIPRGEFSIVIAGLASSTFFATEIQALTITYVIATTFIASFLLRLASSKSINS